MRTLCALMFVGWLGAPLEVADVPLLTVEAAPTLRCPPAPRVVEALTQQLAPEPVRASDAPRGQFHLTLRALGEHGVAMMLREGQALLVERQVEVAPDECDRLAETIALITAAWVRQSGERVEVAEHVEPRPRPSADGTTSSAPRLQTRQVDDVEPPARAPDSSIPSVLTDAPIPQGAPEPAPSHRHGLLLEGGAGTTVSLDGPALPTVTGHAGIAALRDRYRVGLHGHLESARTLDREGEVSVRHAQVELAGGLAIVDERRTVHGVAALGAGVDILSARAPRFARRDTAHSVIPIGTLGLRGVVRAHPALDVFAGAELVLSLWRERFLADGEIVARTARARTRLLVGASWRVF